jgi:GDP-4-dehydro-6-deoxy-D-mannose reductase
MEKKIIITGFSGFVSRHIVDHYKNEKFSGTILGLDLTEPSFNLPSFCSFKNTNLLDEKELGDIINSFRPDYIIHLASYSRVSNSWENPVKSFKNNTNIFLNLIESARIHCPSVRILSIGSSEEYGIVDDKSIPLKETHELNPNSPYAVARVSQELMSKVYSIGYGMDILLTRSFNHYGLHQKNDFFIPSIVKQLCEIKLNLISYIIDRY